MVGGPRRSNWIAAPRHDGQTGYPGVPAYGIPEAGDGNDSGDLLDYWRILRGYKGTLLAAVFTGALAAILITIPLKPVYRARTSLEVLNLNQEFLNMRQSSPVTTSDQSMDTSELLTQVKLLESEALVKRTELKLCGKGDCGFAKVETAVTAPAAPWWRKLVPQFDSAPMSERERLLDKAAKSIKVRGTPRTRVIELTVDSTDRQLATDFANTLAAEYIQLSLESRWNATEKTSAWLVRQIDDERLKLQRAENALQAYARDSGIIFADPETNISSEKLQQIQQEYSIATADRIAKQSRFELTQHNAEESLPEVLNDVGLRETKGKINDLRRQVADLSAVYTPDYSKLKRAQAELAALEGVFSRERASIVVRIRNDYKEAARKETLLAGAYDAQTGVVSSQGQKSIQYSILKREVDSNRQLYDSMLQQLKQSSIATAMRASSIRVVDPAVWPKLAISPNRRLDAALGAGAVLFLTAALILIRKRSDSTLQRPGEAQLLTDIPELGAVPNGSYMLKKQLPVRAAAQVIDAGPLDELDKKGRRRKVKPCVELATLQQSSGYMAEAFRGVLTSILFLESEGGRQTLVLTSASPSEGKTTIVSNLGIALSEIRKKVLIIDADLRRPRIHELFGLKNERGLSSLLAADDATFEEAAQGLIQRTRIPGLHVIPAGSATNSSANLLHSPHLATLLAELKTKYDMILIDTPPMLQIADARIVARLADGVVLVARAEQTTREALVAANQRFAEDGTPILGTILNDWNPRNARNAHYSYRSIAASHVYIESRARR
jgi:capsular exopolysaccharide synthesis family protein